MPKVTELGIQFDGTMSDGDMGKKDGKNLTKVTAISEMLITPKYALVSGFSNNAGDASNQIEVGSTLNNFDIGAPWVFNQLDANPATQQVTPIVGGAWANPLPAATRQINVVGAGMNPLVVTTYIFTLSATGTDTNVVTANTYIYARLTRWFGASATSLNASSPPADIRAALVGSEFGTARGVTKTLNATGGKYLYILYPQAWGAVVKSYLGGFEWTDYTTYSLATYTNAYGVTVPSYLLKSNELKYGSSYTWQLT